MSDVDDEGDHSLEATRQVVLSYLAERRRWPSQRDVLARRGSGSFTTISKQMSIIAGELGSQKPSLPAEIPQEAVAPVLMLAQAIRDQERLVAARLSDKALEAKQTSDDAARAAEAELTAAMGQIRLLEHSLSEVTRRAESAESREAAVRATVEQMRVAAETSWESLSMARERVAALNATLDGLARGAEIRDESLNRAETELARVTSEAAQLRGQLREAVDALKAQQERAESWMARAIAAEAHFSARARMKRATNKRSLR